MDSVDILVIGDFPTPNEIKSNNITHTKLKKVLEVMKIAMTYKGKVELMYMDDSISKPKGKYKLPTGKERITAAVNTLQPKVVLGIGDTVMDIVANVKGITKYRGTKFEINNELGKFKFIPTYSPSYIDQNEGNTKLLEDFARDIYRATRVADGVDVDAKEAFTKVIHITSLSEVSTLCDYVEQVGKFCFDFETPDSEELHTKVDFKPTLLSISFQAGSSYTIPLWHFENTAPEAKTLAIVKMLGDRLFSNPDIQKINQNIKYDIHVLYKIGITVKGRVDDVMLLHHLLYMNDKHGLKDYAPNFFPELEGYENDVHKYSWDQVPMSVLSPYGGIDTDVTIRCYYIFMDMIQKDVRIYTLYRNLVMATFWGLLDAERTGMLIDKDYTEACIERATELMQDQLVLLKKYKQVRRFNTFLGQEAVANKMEEVAEKYSIAEVNYNETGKKIYQNSMAKYKQTYRDIKAMGVSHPSVKFSGINFGTNGATTDVASLLYSKEGFGFKMPWDKKSRERKPLTGREIISNLGDTTGFIDDLLVYRAISKNKSTYMVSFLDKLDYMGYLHSTYNLHGTVTGRLCVSGDTEVMTSDGLVRIDDMCTNDKSYTVLTHKGNYKKVLNKVYKGEEEMFKITLDTGEVIKCTKAHKFLTNIGWLSMENINTRQDGIKIITYTAEVLYRESSIVSVESIGKEGVWDIEVEDDHSYIGNGIVNHNSSSNPNFQNIPSVSKLSSDAAKEVVHMIKNMFIVPKGYTLLGGDYSQAELRLMADYSGDRKMVGAYVSDKDLHTVTLLNVSGISEEEFYSYDKDKQKTMRRDAKAVNFGLIYGMSAAGFMDYARDNYGIIMTIEEATKTREAFFETYESLTTYHDTYIRKCKKFGYVRTLFGRKRLLPDIYSDVPRLVAEAERAAINTPIQGSAGEFMELAIALLRYRLSPAVKFVNTVHDSIMFYVPDALVPETARILKDTCENLPMMEYFGVKLKHLGMKLDLEYSKKSWGSMEEYKEKEFCEKYL